MTTPSNRKFPRANFPCSLTLWRDNTLGTIMANTSNIGAGGLLVYLSESLPISTKLEVKIDFLKDESFRCKGEVLRCQEVRGDAKDNRTPYSIAIIFEGLDESKVATLKKLIDQLLTNESQ